MVFPVPVAGAVGLPYGAGPLPEEVAEKLGSLKWCVALMYLAAVLRLIEGDSILSVMSDFLLALAASYLARGSAIGALDSGGCLVSVLVMAVITASMNLFNAIWVASLIYRAMNTDLILTIPIGSNVTAGIASNHSKLLNPSHHVRSTTRAADSFTTSLDFGVVPTIAGAVSTTFLPTTFMAESPADVANQRLSQEPSRRLGGNTTGVDMPRAAFRVINVAHLSLLAGESVGVGSGFLPASPINNLGEPGKQAEISFWTYALPVTTLLQSFAQIYLAYVCVKAYRANQAVLGEQDYAAVPGGGAGRHAMPQDLEDHMMRQALAQSIQDQGGRSAGPTRNVAGAGGEDPALARALQASMTSQDDSALQLALRASLEDQQRR